jgi:uncharacterized protein (TIGR00255 family)
MISSMTGFARAEARGAYGELVCELRSVNHRYLESGFRLPEELRAIESSLRQVLANVLKRGKVDASLQLRNAATSAASLEINSQVLAQVVSRAREVARAIGAAEERIDPIDVLRWPGVIREQTVAPDELQRAALTLLERTTRELAAVRAREGERLRDLLEQRCAQLASLVEQVRARLPEIQSRLRERMQQRLAELGAKVDAERFEQEIALLLQRLDVAEELDRLVGHIVEVRRIIGGDEPAGRRLDFLMQELNREANTLGSKSQDLDTTRLTVEMKVAIEQMREQVQNIE